MTPGRGTVEGLATPYPLATLTPGVFQEDELVVRLTTALDEVVAPAISVVDCLDAYVDPMLAPADFVDWLAEWVGALLDDHWSDEQRRAFVLNASQLHRLRGTVEGVRELVELATHGDVEILEQGGVRWSTSPSSPAGDAAAEPSVLLIRVAVDKPADLRLASLEELVESAKPAHVPHQIEVTQR